MTELTDSYLADADRLSALLASAADADWSAPSPCEGWSAADVVDHVVDTQRSFLAERDADLGPRPSGTPEEVWAAHTDAVRRAVADDAFVTREYDGYFGRTTVADTLARFYGFDLLVHHWDIARALGRDVQWDDAEMDRIETALDGFGDQLYGEGICQPALDVPDDAPRQVRLLARMGRAA
ncbi:TIGR03086 family metal-binding protein [Nocardioides sp. cx-173]|uniref:TIGR03086 family metal-binding protein n=1 Tax=Nocardioides sp. cx-173 TaxID=2898796 RepID=UPI001E2A0E3E|nr:TIGR03086 family metal-binding protein [Nocardioides sp. cx-173]MCD4527095.1 TIGR03086 family metal-binding protein [Nocardioides sp. cx-173]UGB42459.1 TIGR03086 family metal-binding protein [Nocardioides sp. cx-173]